jgi:hypothetical protein
MLLVQTGVRINKEGSTYQMSPALVRRHFGNPANATEKQHKISSCRTQAAVRRACNPLHECRLTLSVPCNISISAGVYAHRIIAAVQRSGAILCQGEQDVPQAKRHS